MKPKTEETEELNPVDKVMEHITDEPSLAIIRNALTQYYDNEENGQPVNLASPDDLDILARETLSLPHKIMEREKRILARSNKIDTLNRSLKNHESEIYVQVCQERSEEDKQKYPNDNMRKAETDTRMRDRPDVRALWEEVGNCIKDNKLDDIEKEYHRRRQKGISIAVDIAKIKMRIW